MSDFERTQAAMLVLAKRFRSKAHWARDGYYTTSEESSRNEAIREVCEEIASAIDDAFEVNSELTKAERGPW